VERRFGAVTAFLIAVSTLLKWRRDLCSLAGPSSTFSYAAAGCFSTRAQRRVRRDLATDAVSDSPSDALADSVSKRIE